MMASGLESLLRGRGFTPLWIECGPSGRALVLPEMQGRVLALSVGGRVANFVNCDAIERGDGDPVFNNYGGADRLWIGPEAGDTGFFISEGIPPAGEHWRVPDALNRGAFEARADLNAVNLRRTISLLNSSRSTFRIALRRRVEPLYPGAAARLFRAGGADRLEWAGIVTINFIENAGPEAWTPATGIPFVWVLGQFPVGDDVWVRAPVAESAPGPIYNDRYFGRVPPDRLRVREGHVEMRADGGAVSKFGIPGPRCEGRAHAIDGGRGWLYMTYFDADPGARYINNLWDAGAAAPFDGDAFQSYNSGDHTFFELESASPGLALAPGEMAVHRHATVVVHGPPELLLQIADLGRAVDVFP
jgi:hypothetical protein